MAIVREKPSTESSSSYSDSIGSKFWGLFKSPFKGINTNTTSSSSSATLSIRNQHQRRRHHQSSLQPDGSSSSSRDSVLSVVKLLLLPKRRRLKLDPSSKLYFPYEPGKQVRSAIKIQNTSKCRVAFKFQTNAPKSCFMRPPGAILAPGESIIATVSKFVEHPEDGEKPMEQNRKVKFKIMSLKVNELLEYVPEMFDDKQDQVAIEQVLRIVFLDPERKTTALDKLRRQLAESDAAVEAHKKPGERTGLQSMGGGLVIDEWKERRERYLSRQQGKGVVSK